MKGLDESKPTSDSDASSKLESLARRRTKTLQKLLEETENRRDVLTGRFPNWQLWGGSYGPGNTPPSFYWEIQRLEKMREAIILELSRRGKLDAPMTMKGDTREEPAKRTSNNEIVTAPAGASAASEDVPSSPNFEQRKGYRIEIRKWMNDKGLTTIEQAAKKLTLSQSTLKSIMSNKGKRRFGKETLDNVLSKIDCK
jgi:hypothetical protein